MTKNLPLRDGTWVTDACTLPTAEQPLRVAAFDALFGAAVVAVDKVDDHHARFELRSDPAIAGRAAELAMRETQCCSFFTFALVASGGRLHLDVSVPTAHVRVLGALVDRARSGAASVAR
jgi:hypothetical protein